MQYPHLQKLDVLIRIYLDGPIEGRDCLFWPARLGQDACLPVAGLIEGPQATNTLNSRRPFGEVDFVDKSETKGRLHRFSAIFILCFLAFPFYVSAQDGECDDKNPCTEDMPGTNSSCIHTPIVCDDGNPCTDDSYSETGCVHSPVSCDDGIPCTADSCDGSGCISIPVNCDDGNPCTSDRCEGGDCVHFAVSCDDGDPNTTDFCNETGCVHLQTNQLQTNCDSCSTDRLDYGDDALDGDGSEDLDYTNNTGGAVEGVSSYALMICDDGDPCTNDTSDGTNCIHEPVNCDDGNPCTDDLCNETGCVHIPVTCDDGNACTDDVCNSTGCHYAARICDDGHPCTTDFCDPVKGCINVTKNCDDSRPCTDDSCDGSGNCVHEPKDYSDGDACTIDFCDRRGRCIHMLRSCDDGNPCTVDYCDSAWGCEHTPVVCDGGKVCFDGTCRHPPNYQSPYVAAPGSYIIPSGTALPLPWGSEVTALGPMRVDNAVVVSAPDLPMEFVREIGFQLNPDMNVISISISPVMMPETAEMIGLTWQGGPLDIVLTNPDGIALRPDGTSPDVVRMKGSNYEYYFLMNPAIGNWIIRIRPSDRTIVGERFTLVTGKVGGAIPSNPS